MKKAQAKIKNFLVNKLKISTENIIKKNNSDYIWLIKVSEETVNVNVIVLVIEFKMFSCQYWITDGIGHKLIKTKYKDIDKIKSNFKKIIKAVRLFEELR